MDFDNVTRGTGLEGYGITGANLIYWTPPTTFLLEQVVKRGERLHHTGDADVTTWEHAGHADSDKFIVEEPTCVSSMARGKLGHSFSLEKFNGLYKRMLTYMQNKDIFVQDCFAGADKKCRLPIRVITELAWHSLSARQVFMRATPEEVPTHAPQFAIIDLPGFHAIPALDGTNSDSFIIFNFPQKVVFIGGTTYAGEIIKSMFGLLNYLLPLESGCHSGVHPEHPERPEAVSGLETRAIES